MNTKNTKDGRKAMKRKKAKMNMFLIAALTMILVAWKASPVYASDLFEGEELLLW